MSWRVERARRAHGVVQFEVIGRPGRRTFLAPFDRPRAAATPERPQRVRPQAIVARLAGFLGRDASCRTLTCARDADIDLHAYQLEPALALQAHARRVLVADAVGLGKTIQAGLVIAERHARQPRARVLVIAPSPLRRQWADELRRHFRLEAREADPAQLDAVARAAPLGHTPWTVPGVWIGSMDYLKQPQVLESACQQTWDLVVVDEAHAVCGHSERHAAADALARRAFQVLLLSATPHNGDEERFERLIELGALSRADEIVVFRRTHATLGMARVRRVRWHLVHPTDRETRLLDALSAFERTALRGAGPSCRSAALLLLSVFRKRALSTISALLVSLERRLACIEQLSAAASPTADAWRQQRFLFEGDEDDWSEDERRAIGADIGLRCDLERSWLRRLRELARAATGDETKRRRLVSLARRTREPLVVFTEFRDTVNVLLPELQRVRPVAVLHGGQRSGEQREQLHRFLSGAATVLVATDVASQGLNLQSCCRWVLNMEVPWNPARIEQRAGRVDRLGQRRPVHVGLLVSAHDAEAGVLAHLARRACSARQRVGNAAIDLPGLDEHAVRAHVLTGSPLLPPVPRGPAIEFCRTWVRPARVAAHRLARQRALASHWRARLGTGRASEGHIRRLASLQTLAQRGVILAYSVPLLDGLGQPIESRLVFVQLDGARPSSVTRVVAFDAARQAAARAVSPRARRLCRLGVVLATRAAANERTVAAELLAPLGTSEVQPGLFDRRSLRAAAQAEAVRAEIHRACEERLAHLDAQARVEVGSPMLQLVITFGQ